MVKNVIKVFARLKKELKDKNKNSENFIISKSENGCEDLIIHHKNGEFRKEALSQFRYHKVFDQNAAQKDVFEIVAKPVVSSVIHGFNGTIFAYGQTGSGKTYSITGCPKLYENRGILPRCIEYVFEYLNKNPEVYTVHLSYMEIYNEIGYDLLNPKQIASRLEEFPRVLLLDNGKGEAHLRNLTIHPVCTEKEAMRFLFLGDTNRTIAETPINDYSSRSHCVFTIYLTSKIQQNGKQLKSKLHIVDLAGSERLHKSNITGTTLREAKHINLSLHYLQQVIMALTTKKSHIPFRNSMLTSLLKDSLCGNSLTSMLATLAITKNNLEETISTCRFSKRVSLISTDPYINEERSNPEEEFDHLYNEINKLKLQLSKYEEESKKDPYKEMLTEDKKEYCRKTVDDFLSYSTEMKDLSMAEMKFCMETMRDTNSDKNNKIQQNQIEEIQELKNIIRQRDEEILTLKELLEIQVNSIGKSPKYNFHKQSPIWKYKNEIEDCNEKLDEKYREAKEIVSVIDQCRCNIIDIRTKLDGQCTDNIKECLTIELYQQQDIYRNSIMSLRDLEKETNHLKFGLLQIEMKLKRENTEYEGASNNSQESCKFLNYTYNLDELTGDEKENDSSLSLTKSTTFLQSLLDNSDFGVKHFGYHETPLNDWNSQRETTEIQEMEFKWGNFNGSEEKLSCPSKIDSIESSISVPDVEDEEGWFKEYATQKVPKKVINRKRQQKVRKRKIKKFPEHVIYEDEEKLEESSIFINEPDDLIEEPKCNDSPEFIEFMKTIPLTGDREVDDEIYNFYKSKFENKN